MNNNIPNSLSIFYKKSGGTSKFIEVTLAIYDRGKLIYNTPINSDLHEIEAFINVINEKFGLDYKIVKGDEIGRKK